MAPLGPFAADRRLMVAVSGGADSMALALLLSRWGQPRAAIVDHGLRPDSASEAALTAARLHERGIDSVILQAALAPGPAAAERARAARYALLLAACRDAGWPDLALAHHAADQAETVRMRRDAGSDTAGLAGMAALSFRAEARLLRPLLALAPARLRATLRAAGLPWVDDPTNLDQRTLRARLRARMDRADRAAALQLAARHGASRRADEASHAAELSRVLLYPEGYAIVSTPIGPAALSALIWTISGQLYPPPRAALMAGLAPRTLHGVLLRPAGRLGPGTLIAREPAAVARPVAASAGLRWDGRFRLDAAPEPGLSIGALGADAARMRQHSTLPSVVLQTLPTLRRDGIIAAVPHLAFPDASSCRNLQVWFCPERPAAGAPFVLAAPVNPCEGQGV